MTDSQYNMFDNLMYILYDVFFEMLSSSSLNCIMKCNHNLKNIIIDGGGCARNIKFNWRTNLMETMSRLSINKRIEKIDYNGSGLQLCPFDFLPMQKIKIIILREPSNKELRWPDKKIATTKTLKRPRSLRNPKNMIVDSNMSTVLSTPKPSGSMEVVQPQPCGESDKKFVWKDIEYLFIIDNNAQDYIVSLGQFPSLKFIGCYKSTVTFVDEGEKMPFVMDFRDIDSIEMMVSYSHKNMKIIGNTLQKIYHHLN